MAAFIIADIRVEDPEAYKDYVAQVPALVAKHGGIYRARGGEHETLEGDWSPNRIVLLEFPDAAAAHAWFDGRRVVYRRGNRGCC